MKVERVPVMNKVILIPDSFKGTLSSTQICEIISAEITKQFPSCKVISIPVADGGEGSVDCFLSALGGQKITATVNGPHFEKMKSYFGMIANRNNNDSYENKPNSTQPVADKFNTTKFNTIENLTAVIEMASCAGLPLVENNKDPLGTTTYGVGKLILAATKQNAQKIIVGLGGSCTTDGGCGAAAACGVKFYDKTEKCFVPTGGTLKQIKRIDISELNPMIKNTEIIAMCDIENPMYGPEGAAFVFGPQKGASPDEVKFLDEGLIHLSKIIERDLGLNVAAVPGAGAAGAMGAGMIAFFGAHLQMGIETVLDTVHFSDTIKGADLVFTGEGRLDAQSLRGKVVIGVAKRSQKEGVPVIALVGGVDGDMKATYDMGVTAIFSINRLPEDFSISKNKSAENLAATVQDVLRVIKVSKEESNEKF